MFEERIRRNLLKPINIDESVKSKQEEKKEERKKEKEYRCNNNVYM